MYLRRSQGILTCVGSEERKSSSTSTQVMNSTILCHSLLRRSVVLVAAAVVAVMPGGVNGDEAGDNSLPEASVIERAAELAADLNSNNFQQRRAAFLGLWAMGPETLAMLETIDEADPQVEATLRVLRVLLKLNIAPEDRKTARILNLLQKPTPLSISELCRRGHWDIAQELLRSERQLKAQFQQSSGALQLGRIVEMALEQGEPALAWPVLAQLVDLPLASWISKKTGLPAPEVDAKSVSQVATRDFYRGDVEKALAAPLSARQRLRFITRGAQWSELANPEVQAALIGRPTPAVDAATRAVLFEAANQFDRADHLWGSFEKIALEQAKAEDKSKEISLDFATRKLLQNDPFRSQLLMALMIDGRINPVGEYLLQTEESHAAIYFISNSKFEQAFKAVGLDGDLSNFDDWVAKQQRTLADQYKTTLPWMRTLRHCTRICNSLVDIGHRDEARVLLQMLIDECKAIRGSGESDRASREEYIWRDLRWLYRAESRQLLLSEVMRVYDDLPEQIQEKILNTLYLDFASCAKAFMDTAPLSKVVNSDVSQDRLRWELMENLRILNRDYFSLLPPGTLADWIQAAKAKFENRPATGGQLEQCAELALGFGLTELAMELTTEPMATDRSHWMTAAELLMQQGAPEAASDLLQMARKSYSSDRYSSLPIEIEAELMSGHFDQAAILQQFQWMLPMLPKYVPKSTYYSISTALSFREDYENAREYGEPAFLLENGRGPYDFEVARSYGSILDELNRPLEGADVRRAVFIEALGSSAPLSEVLLTHDYWYFDYMSRVGYSMQKERMARAISCIRERDFTAAGRHMKVAQRLQPQDIELVCQCYPELVQQGQQELADSIFDSFESTMMQQIEAWPKDSTALNNLAWMYTQCDRKLAEALSLAERAVKLTPSSAVYLDTLAEVHFRKGDPKAAFEAMKKCTALDPRDKHYRTNLVRFGKAANAE